VTTGIFKKKILFLAAEFVAFNVVKKEANFILLFFEDRKAQSRSQLTPKAESGCAKKCKYF
jgi:hypothetical protein